MQFVAFLHVSCAGCVACSHPRPRTSHVVVRIRVHVRREVDGMERLGRLHLFDLATPESAIPSHYSAVEADEAKDVALSVFRLGARRCGGCVCSQGAVLWYLWPFCCPSTLLLSVLHANFIGFVRSLTASRHHEHLAREPHATRNILRRVRLAGELLSAVGRREELLPHQYHVLTQLAHEGVAGGRSLFLAHVNPTAVGAPESEKCLRFATRVRSSNMSA